MIGVYLKLVCKLCPQLWPMLIVVLGAGLNEKFSLPEESKKWSFLYWVCKSDNLDIMAVVSAVDFLPCKYSEQ